MRKVAIAGIGAIGSVVANKLIKGMHGLELVAVSDIKGSQFSVPNVTLDKLSDTADIIVECLPADQVAALAASTLEKDKIFVCISSSALLAYPEILAIKSGELIIPSGAIAGIDGLKAMMQKGSDINIAIKTTKQPLSLKGAPYILEQGIDLDKVTSKKTIFSGNAFDAAKGFPANVNVAATLSLHGPGPENVTVEIVADPDIPRTVHEILLSSDVSNIHTRVENMPDPNNPKSSQLTALSILSELEKLGKRPF